MAGPETGRPVALAGPPGDRTGAGRGESRDDGPEDGPEHGPEDGPDRALRGFTGYLMKRAFNLVQADLTRALDPFGLRMVSFSALTVVVDSPGLSQTDLSNALAIERSNLVAVVDGLAARGLVRRDPVRDDRRAYALLATEAGIRLAAEARRAVAAHEARLFAVLEPDEQAALRRALEKVTATG